MQSLFSSRWGRSVAMVSAAAATAVLGASLGPTDPSAALPVHAEEQLLAQAEALTSVSFTLSWLPQGVDAPLTLALDKGYFEAEGLDVTYERGFGSADSINKIAAGQYDIGFGDAYSMIEFNQKNPDQQLTAVAIPYNRSPFSIITLKDSGIATPQDLEGRTLGAPAGDAPRRLWPIFAQQVGVGVDSVSWTTMEPKLRQTFLLQGQVDAISAFVYSALPALINGGKTLDDLNIFYYNDNGVNFYGNAVITRVDYAEENPEVVEGFLRAYIKGIQDTMMDPSAGLDSVMAADDSGLMKREDEKLRLQIALDDLMMTDEVAEMGIGTVDPERFETTIAQVVEGFELSETPSIDEVFDESFLPPLEERALPPESERQALE